MTIKKELRKLILNESSPILDSELQDFSELHILLKRNQLPKLFRFSLPDYNNIRGLETQTLFLSPVEYLNDVFEGLSCKIDYDVLSLLDNLHGLAYIKSFSEDPKNLLMWAHYANNYSGMCVQYDFTNLEEKILCHLFPVIYSKKRRTSNVLSEYIEEEIKKLKASSPYDITDESVFLQDIMSLFLVKSSCWSYEKEWRIIATYPQMFYREDETDNKGAEIFYQIENNQTISVKDCIKAVYLGPKIEERIKEHIEEIYYQKLHGVKVYSGYLSKDKYEMEFLRVS